MPWFKRSDGSMGRKEEGENDDIEFKPEKFKEELETSFKTKLDEMQTASDAKMKPLLDMAAQLQADRDAREAEAKKKREEKAREDNDIKDEDWLLDPEAAVEKKLSGTNKAVMMLASRQARREVLEDKPYYYGDIKTKVDAMIDAQALSERMNPNVITNCYKLVMYDHDEDVKSGKIKARNTSMIFEGQGTGAHSGKQSNDSDEVMSNEEKHAASALGLSEAQWKSSKKELSYV